MPVPTYDRFIEPILRYLAAHPEGAPAREVHDAAATLLKLTESDRQELLPSGVQPIYKNRAGWAHDRMKRAGLSQSTRRGFWCLTSDGVAFAAKNRSPLAADVLESLAINNTDVRLRDAGSVVTTLPATAPAIPATATASPDDRLEQALAELRRTVAAEVLESLRQVSPGHFEIIVLDVLHRMGYGASRADVQRVGGSGDAGIDGIISLDKLGLERCTSRRSAGNSPWVVPTSRRSMGPSPGSGRTRASSSPPPRSRRKRWSS